MPLDRSAAAPVSLLRLIWRSYLTSALVPVFFIELALIAAYFITNSVIREQNITTQQRLATEQLQYIAHQQAEHISSQLASVASNVDLLRRHAERAFVTPFVPDAEESSRYALSLEGALHTTHGLPGRAALIYSKPSRISESERTKALQFAQLDPLLQSLVETQPLVTQAYVDTADHLTRFYPYREYEDVIAASGPGYDFSIYSYYYEADATHNPERKVVWTDVHVDTAGQGWMVSATAPIYPGSGDRMEGVAGLDVTIDRLTNQVLQLHFPWNGYGMLVGKDGTILALTTQGERDWKLKELSDYSYHEPIRQDTFKPDTFNLLKREDGRALGQQLASAQQGLETVTLAGRSKQVAWSTVKSTDWKLLVVVDEADIFAEAYELNRRVLRVGLGMIAGLILFYALFFGWLYQKVRRMSGLLAEPLLDLESMMQRIGQGEYTQPRPTYPIIELQRTGEGLVQMGQHMGQSNASLQQARTDLEQLNLKLEERIQHRTRELEMANAALNQENTAKQGLIQELQRTQNQLIQSEKLASLAHLTSGIAHELKNPLNLINNLSEASIELSQELGRTLRERPQVLLSEVQDIIMDFMRNAAIVHQHGVRADHIIRSMMEHAQGRTGALEPTDVKPLLEHYLTLTYAVERARSPRLEVTFVREFDPTVGKVQAMPQQLGRVLQNLIHNAMDAVSMKQRQSTHDYVPTITLRTCREGGNVVLQVEDNGPGIPKDLHSRIFEPFFTTKPPGGGNTGLGLSLSYDIVKLHGGNLTVESELGQYTRFTVSLPACDTPQVVTAG
ncbi:sensor histidine kinase [Hyalangium rubrum]|uniref:histidine kinase n=1 Tax=Hyalangium rubrum TaxID=3103134 RepID=A0ABU5H0A8_9BACT|nr:ATP-binding protein [Hyalangium sp. s54d21]MDY7226554.1 ATP-binding protein [Hyalangium sp. s54d21]